MIHKYKKHIIIFLASFIIYFLCGLIITYNFNTYNTWNVMFEFDTPRVVGDLTLYDFDHYRVAVHPLFVILFQPIVLLINIIMNNSIISCLLLQSLLSASILCIVYTCIKKICNSNLCTIFICLFGMSLPQFVFTTSIETFIFAQFFLVLLWLFAMNKIDKRLTYWDYVILFLLGICSIAVTITNFFQFIIVVLFVLMFNKKNKHRIFSSLFIIVGTLSFSVFLAEIQNIIWPTAPNFFTKFINDIIYNTSEEVNYMTKSITLNNFVNVLNSNYAQSYNIFDLIVPKEGTNIIFANTMISNIFSIICGIIFIILNIIFFKKNIDKIYNHKLYLALLLTYIFNYTLHLLYGNEISFLYICHYNFILIYLYAYLIDNLFVKKISIKKTYIIIFIIFLLFIRGLIELLNKLIIIYNLSFDYNLSSIIIILLSFLLIIIFLFKSYKVKKNGTKYEKI